MIGSISDTEYNFYDRISGSHIVSNHRNCFYCYKLSVLHYLGKLHFVSRLLVLGLDQKDIEELQKLAIKNKKKLAEVVEQTSDYFSITGKPVTNLFGVIKHGIENGWSIPKSVKGKFTDEANQNKQPAKKLPKTIAKEITEPTFTDEELQGTYDDIQATMRFLRSTENQVLQNKE